MEKFFNAIRKDNIKYIKTLIKKGEDLNKRGENGESPIILAIKLGNYKLVKLLIDSKIALDTEDDLGRTPLVFSMIETGVSPKLVEMLVEAGSRVEFNNQDEDTLEELEKFVNDNEDIEIEVLKALKIALNQALEGLGDRYLESAVEEAEEEDNLEDKAKEEKKIIKIKETEEESNFEKKVYIVKGFFKSYFSKRLDKEEFEMFLLEKGEEILNSKDYRKFSNGDRIKKIRSEDKVFELRINSGDRVLFTITEMGIIFLCVDNHDNAVARGRKVKVDEVIHLKAAADEIEEIPISKVIQRPIYESVSIEKFKSKLLDKKELYLLTGQQEQIVNSHFPICLYGSAGSGKTTMLLKKIENFLKYNEDKKILFLTYNEKLLKYTKSLYNTYSGYKTDQITFETFENYFIDQLNLDKDSYFNTEKFMKWFGDQKGYNPKLKDISSLEAFSEIKGIIKGFVGYTGKRDIENESMISKEYYMELKNRYSLLKSDASRELVYEEAKSYEKYLKENNFYDENDLAIRYLNSEKDFPKYDFLACDEVQDLTELQIIAMLETLIDNKNVFLTGDNNQAINLSFFDFSRLKTLYQERYHYYGIDNNEISLNQRSSEKIVDLAKRVADIRDTVLPVNRRINYREEPLIEGGIIPILASKEGVDLSQLENKDVTIIVPDELQKRRIKRFYNNTVLTIYEAKGLERENIVCIGLIGHFEDDTKVIVDKLKSNKKELLSNHYRHFFNLLYVATTRARNNLIFLDDTENEFYSFLEEGIKKADEKQWQERFKSLSELTEDKLLKYAIEYEEKGNYQIALEHHEKMKEKDEGSIKRLKALIDMESKNYKEALEVFEGLEMWNECLECSKNLGDRKLEKEYQIKVYKSEREFLELARYYSNHKEDENAFDSYMMYFKEEQRESKDIKKEFYGLIKRLDRVNFKKNDHEFIIQNTFEIPQLLELAVDICIVIKGDIEEATNLLKRLSNESKRAKFNLFLLEGNETLWENTLDNLGIEKGPLYKNFCLKGRNKKIDDLINSNLSLENLDLLVKNGYKADSESVDGDIITYILEEDRKNLIRYYLFENNLRDKYKDEIKEYLERLIDGPREITLEKFKELEKEPYKLLLDLYFKHSGNKNIKIIINEGLLAGELQTNLIDKIYINLVDLKTYLEIRKRRKYNNENILLSLDYKSMEIKDIFLEEIEGELELVLRFFLEKKNHLIPPDYYTRLSEEQKEKFKEYYVAYESSIIDTSFVIYNICNEEKVLKIDGKIYQKIKPNTQVKLKLEGSKQIVSLGDEAVEVTLKDIILGKNKVIFD